MCTVKKASIFSSVCSFIQELKNDKRSRTKSKPNDIPWLFHDITHVWDLIFIFFWGHSKKLCDHTEIKFANCSSDGRFASNSNKFQSLFIVIRRLIYKVHHGHVFVQRRLLLFYTMITIIQWNCANISHFCFFFFFGPKHSKMACTPIFVASASDPGRPGSFTIVQKLLPYRPQVRQVEKFTS